MICQYHIWRYQVTPRGRWHVWFIPSSHCLRKNGTMLTTKKTTKAPHSCPFVRRHDTRSQGIKRYGIRLSFQSSMASTAAGLKVMDFYVGNTNDGIWKAYILCESSLSIYWINPLVIKSPFGEAPVHWLSSPVLRLEICFMTISCDRNVSMTAFTLNSSPPEQNGRHSADRIFKYIFVNEKLCILIKMSLKLVP